MTEVSRNLDRVRERIARAAARAGRPAGAVRLVAVSKTRPVADIAALAARGQVEFGESRVQEARAKRADSPSGLCWHLIGHLQSNKAREAAVLFDWVHSLDSEKTALRLARAAAESGRTLQVLIQVNVSGDPAKHGLAPGELFAFSERLLALQPASLILRGLMTIGRRDAGEADTRHAFARLRALARAAGERLGAEHFRELSMGMSGDYEIAVEEGATLVRVGTALFGPRGPC